MHRPRHFIRILIVAGVTAGFLALAPPVVAMTAPAHVTYVANPASLVDTFVGTSEGGDTFPGADVPFGMMQWSPDTNARPDGGGYEYYDNDIIGYSLTHLSGPGCQAEGDVPILPTVGPIGHDPTDTVESFRHSSETATPGYYQLIAGGVTTQLTTTTHAGIARFTFPTSGSAHLLFQLAESQTTDSKTEFQVVNSHEVEGYVTSGYFCGATNTYTLHFDIVFNDSITGYGVWHNGKAPIAGVSKIEDGLSASQVAGVRVWAYANSGRSVASSPSPYRGYDGAYLTFDTHSSPVVTAKVGISYVSNADAILNRTTEIPGWNFNQMTDAAHRAWNQALEKIQIAGGTRTQQSVFYTALYHSLLHPNVASDVNGRYMGADGKVHTVESGQAAEYANYSGWDIYRSEIQLLAMLFPARASDIVTSMLEDYSATGMLPKWSEDNGESFIMVGDPADSIIADAYAFGARGFDASTALADMVQEASASNEVRPGLNYYKTDGYLPIDGTYGCCNYYGSVSTQEEYDVADSSISLLAADLGDTQTAKSFAATAQNWQNVFDPDSGFLQPKLSDGAFQSGFSPVSENGFVEADSWVYTAELPFDLEGAAAAKGGDTAWVNYLNLVTKSVTSMAPNEIQMGDEPSFDIPWEYDYVGAPYKTQQVVREIQNDLFTLSPYGIPGNDDLGATSSWLVWSAIGGYPETPGSETVAAGSPMFDSIDVSLGDGKQLFENAPGARTYSYYVQGVEFDGSQWSNAFLSARAFSKGGTLDWTLSKSPDTTWGSAPADAPPSDTEGLSSAIGYMGGTSGDTQTVAAGSGVPVTLGAQSLDSAGQDLSWTDSTASGSGITIGPSSGHLKVSAEGKATVSVEIHVPVGTAKGIYPVSFKITGTSGEKLRAVVDEVTVTSG
jgi:predicted alpha-1,2-mannosidase